jgi:hypothetical protein
MMGKWLGTALLVLGLSLPVGQVRAEYSSTVRFNDTDCRSTTTKVGMGGNTSQYGEMVGGETCTGKSSEGLDIDFRVIKYPKNMEHNCETAVGLMGDYVHCTKNSADACVPYTWMNVAQNTFVPKCKNSWKTTGISASWEGGTDYNGLSDDRLVIAFTCHSVSGDECNNNGVISAITAPAAAGECDSAAPVCPALTQEQANQGYKEVGNCYTDRKPPHTLCEVLGKPDCAGYIASSSPGQPENSSATPPETPPAKPNDDKPIKGEACSSGKFSGKCLAKSSATNCVKYNLCGGTETASCRFKAANEKACTDKGGQWEGAAATATPSQKPASAFHIECTALTDVKDQPDKKHLKCSAYDSKTKAPIKVSWSVTNKERTTFYYSGKRSEAMEQNFVMYEAKYDVYVRGMNDVETEPIQRTVPAKAATTAPVWATTKCKGAGEIGLTDYENCKNPKAVTNSSLKWAICGDCGIRACIFCSDNPVKTKAGFAFVMNDRWDNGKFYCKDGKKKVETLVLDSKIRHYDMETKKLTGTENACGCVYYPPNYLASGSSEYVECAEDKYRPVLTKTGFVRVGDYCNYCN